MLPLMLAGCFQSAVPQMPDVPYVQLDGSVHRTTDLKGKVLIVNFWATSCATCVKEMPDLVATHQKFQAQGLETLAVAMSYDSPEYVAQFKQSRQLPFKVAFDRDGGVSKAFGDIQMTPTTFVVNRRGEIVKRFVGEPDFAALHKLLAELLNQPA
ncbi:MAG: TlpA disulfide reductase family protein [Aquabacterium sp.]|uniref:TlpA disulfide reductase family protein n=1 Tax=Aquabacterium sp. TaxID=1872578 RepID=UPI003BE58DFA